MRQSPERKIRELRKIVEAEGGEIVDWYVTGGNHLKVQVSVGKASFLMVAALSTSDWHGEKNWRSQLRKKIQGAQHA